MDKRCLNIGSTSRILDLKLNDKSLLDVPVTFDRDLAKMGSDSNRRGSDREVANFAVKVTLFVSFANKGEWGRGRKIFQ